MILLVSLALMTRMASVGIISGTGVRFIEGLAAPHNRCVETPYGDATVTLGSLAGVPVAWIRRHGAGHYLSPTAVNYHANLLALNYLGVESILATNAVGAVSPSLAVGDLCILQDLIGFTRSPRSFYRRTVVHTNFSHPYSARLRAAMRAAASSLNLEVMEVVYAAMVGPRFESPAEIQALRRLGGSVVGMTGDLECGLACELGQEYASIGVVSNNASRPCEPVGTRAITSVIDGCVPTLSAILAATVSELSRREW